MNKLIISGNLGKDAEKKEYNGKSIINFSIAVTDKVKGQDKTTWFEASYFSEHTGILPYLVKGAKVLLDGKLTSREYESKTYLGILVNNIELLGSKQETTSTPAATYQKAEVIEPEYVDNLPF